MVRQNFSDNIDIISNPLYAVQNAIWQRTKRRILFMERQLQGNWMSLCDRLITQLSDLRYNNSTLTNYRRALNRIGRFMDSHSYNDYFENVGRHYYDDWIKVTKPKPESTRFIKAIIHRLNDTLSEVSHQSRHTSHLNICPACFAGQADRYFDYLRFQGIRESTISLNRRYCFEFFRFLADIGIDSFSGIVPEHIYAAFAKTGSATNFCVTVSSFLKFAYSNNYNATDLSVFVPKPRRPQPLPSIYTDEEIHRMLAAIDTSTLIGKRDCAILSLAAMLGLRRSDICNLTLENIDFYGKKIRLIQQKTNIPLEIELLPETEQALLSYIDVVKPASNNTPIFLSERAPYAPLQARSVYNIARKRFHSADIDVTGKKQGTHSLRMSLASHLVSEDVPYSVIQKILGQDDPNSTKHYARIDVDKLRLYALDIPPPSGLFAERLGMAGGGQ
jgi:site-specific recombinase XerD